jgi:hypothetical protein
MAETVRFDGHLISNQALPNIKAPQILRFEIGQLTIRLVIGTTPEISGVGRDRLKWSEGPKAVQIRPVCPMPGRPLHPSAQPCSTSPNRIRPGETITSSTPVLSFTTRGGVGPYRWQIPQGCLSEPGSLGAADVLSSFMSGSPVPWSASSETVRAALAMSTRWRRGADA